jgi:hypothetical protein
VISCVQIVQTVACKTTIHGPVFMKRANGRIGFEKPRKMFVDQIAAQEKNVESIHNGTSQTVFLRHDSVVSLLLSTIKFRGGTISRNEGKTEHFGRVLITLFRIREITGTNLRPETRDPE